jgi:AcrR family transcriptional regulator
MTTREKLLMAALTVLEEEGEAQFSTRAVCTIAGVGAPTLYHYFGSADGLLSAAMSLAFDQFLARKLAASDSPDPVTNLRQGCEDYVLFAAEKPKLYAAMLSRVLQGATIPAADRAYAHMNDQLQAIAAAGRLAVPVETAADLIWASANAAAQLFVTARFRKAAPPDPAIVVALREQAMRSILQPEKEGFVP